MGHASKERVLLIGTDQRITSGPAATTAAFKGRIHGCTRTIRANVRFFSLAPRAPSIHGPSRHLAAMQQFGRFLSETDINSLAGGNVFSGDDVMPRRGGLQDLRQVRRLGAESPHCESVKTP
jgi:hypothetical protein